MKQEAPMRRTIMLTCIGVCLLGLIAFVLVILPSRVVYVEYADMATIDQAEREWQAANIRKYQLTVDYLSFGVNERVKTTVVDGNVVAVECYDKDTKSSCEDSGYTVPDLFRIARKYSERSDRSASLEDKRRAPFGVLFDSTNHYPRYMVWRPSEYSTWDVTSFTVLW